MSKPRKGRGSSKGGGSKRGGGVTPPATTTAGPEHHHHLRRDVRLAEYRLGVEHAVQALIDDLPGVAYDDEGRSVECCACVLRAHAFDLLAVLWEEAVGAAPHGEPGATA